MPVEDTLKYKVELDTSDVASQLQDLQGQIKSFSAGAVAPFFSVEGLGAPRNIDPTFRGIDVYNNILRQAENMPPLRAAAESMFGFNYDPRLPIGRDEYLELFRKQAFDSVAAENLITELGGSLGFGGLGAAVGGMFGPLGAAAGMVIGGYLGGPLASSLSGNEEARLMQTRANFLRIMSMRSRGGLLSETESFDVANRVGQWQDSGYARDARLKVEEIDTLLSEFTGAGGFELTTDVNDFKRTIDTLISNARTVMHVLHMSTNEAAQFMGTMSRIGIDYPAGLATTLAAAPTTLGIMPSEAIQLGIQGMGAMANFGVEPNVAFMGAIGMTAAMRGLQLPQGLLGAVGGEAGAGVTLYQQALNAALSPEGFAPFVARQARGGIPVTNIFEQFGIAAGVVAAEGPVGFMRLQAEQQISAREQNPAFLIMQNINQHLQEAKVALNVESLDRLTYMGYLTSQKGLSYPEAMLESEVAANIGTFVETYEQAGAIDIVRAITPPTRGIFGYLWDEGVRIAEEVDRIVVVGPIWAAERLAYETIGPLWSAPEPISYGEFRQGMKRVIRGWPEAHVRRPIREIGRFFEELSADVRERQGVFIPAVDVPEDESIERAAAAGEERYLGHIVDWRWRHGLSPMRPIKGEDPRIGSPEFIEERFREVRRDYEDAVRGILIRRGLGKTQRVAAQGLIDFDPSAREIIDPDFLSEIEELDPYKELMYLRTRQEKLGREAVRNIAARFDITDEEDMFRIAARTHTDIPISLDKIDPSRYAKLAAKMAEQEEIMFPIQVLMRKIKGAVRQEEGYEELSPEAKSLLMQEVPEYAQLEELRRIRIAVEERAAKIQRGLSETK